MNFINKIYNSIVSINIYINCINIVLVLFTISIQFIVLYSIDYFIYFITQIVLDIYSLIISYFYNEYNRNYYLVNKYNSISLFIYNIFEISRNIVFTNIISDKKKPLTNEQIDMFIYCFLLFASIYSFTYKIPYIFTKKRDVYIPSTIINNNNKYTCSICFENKCDLLLKCNHSFHYDCIKIWYKDHNSCPYCRSSIK